MPMCFGSIWRSSHTCAKGGFRHDVPCHRFVRRATSLIVEHRDASAWKFFLGLAIACAASAIVPALFDRSFMNEEQFVGRLAGAGLLALFALVFSENSRFTFDR